MSRTSSCTGLLVQPVGRTRCETSTGEGVKTQRHTIVVRDRQERWVQNLLSPTISLVLDDAGHSLYAGEWRS